MSAKGILKKGLYTSSVRTEQSNAATLGLSLLLLLASPKKCGEGDGHRNGPRQACCMGRFPIIDDDLFSLLDTCCVLFSNTVLLDDVDIPSVDRTSDCVRHFALHVAERRGIAGSFDNHS